MFWRRPERREEERSQERRLLRFRLQFRLADLFFVSAIAALISFVIAERLDTTGRLPLKVPVRCLTYSADANLLAAGCEDGITRENVQER